MLPLHLRAQNFPRGSGVFLSQAEADAIDGRIARIEARTGAQIVAAVVARSDGYPEVVWKAFALGAAAAALIVVALDLAHPDWMSAHATLANVLPVIGAGAASALLTVGVPRYARLFLDRFRIDGEVRQHAQAMFLERQLFRTQARTGVLMLVSLFERKVEIQADVGFDGRIGGHQWHSVVAAMMPMLTNGRLADAIGAGLDRVEQLLVSRHVEHRAGGPDELPNRPIEEGGV